MANRTTAFNGLHAIYAQSELLSAKLANRCTPSGVYYTPFRQTGLKMAGCTLLKEAHHTRDDIRRSKTWLVRRSAVCCEVGTAKPDVVLDSERDVLQVGEARMLTKKTCENC